MAERNLWMFPRPIRNVNPYKIAALLSILGEIGEGQPFMTSQCLQDDMTRAMKTSGFVRGTQDVVDEKSGGARTFIALLEALGLTFQKDGALRFTLAGEALQRASAPMSIIRKQILRLQYPSPYSTGSGVRLSTEFKVRPFIFLLGLMARKELEGTICDEEIAVALACAKDHSSASLSNTIEGILRLRKGEALTEVLAGLNLTTPRKKDANDRAFLVDIANTFSNVLRAGGLITEIPGHKPLQYTLTANALSDEFQEVSSEPLLDHRVSEEQFQRRFGRGDKRKDTRLFMANAQPGDWRKAAILAKLLETSSSSIITAPLAVLAEGLAGHLSLPQALVEETIAPYMAKTGEFFLDNYRFLSCSGSSKAIEFEKATCEMFQALGFQAKLTGQLHRKGLGGFADVFLVSADNVTCGVVDCKASPRYDLPHKDILAMKETYLPAAEQELASKGQKVVFALYVASGFTPSMPSRLNELAEASSKAASAITAERLISRLRSVKGSSKDEREQAHFTMAQAISSGGLIH